MKEEEEVELEKEIQLKAYKTMGVKMVSTKTSRGVGMVPPIK